tara:strand:- start:418 stop:711 length:294 start_codon:yes stop_codon:yes gene_type:complete
MTAQVSKISPPLKSKSGGVYQKIEFITKPFNTYGYTYISPENYNFENWKPIIESPNGVWVQNINWKDEARNLIDADSKVIFHKHKRNQAVTQLDLKF